MSKLLATKTGNVFLGGDDENNAGKTLEMEEIKKTGQVLIASSANEDVIGLGAVFVRAFDYANDQIGYVTTLSGGIRKIIVYDIPNDKFIYNVEKPQPLPTFEDIFFVNQNLFSIRNWGEVDEWGIFKYTFPGLVPVSSYLFEYVLMPQVETNLDKIILWDLVDAEDPTPKWKRLSDSFVVEVNASAGGNAAEMPIAADTNYSYRKKYKSGDTLPYEIERGTLSYTGFSSLFTYGAPFNFSMVADKGDVFIPSGLIDGTIRVYNSTGVLQTTFSNVAEVGIVMASIGLTQNYITVVETGNITIYDRSYNLVRIL